MHELGIIVHITKTLQNVAKENNLSEIGSVTLEIGEVSTIVPDYLTDCWKYYRKKFPLIEHSELKIEILPATTYCEDSARRILQWNSADSAHIVKARTRISCAEMNVISRKLKHNKRNEKRKKIMLFHVYGENALPQWIAMLGVLAALILLNEVARRTKAGGILMFFVIPAILTVYFIAIAVGAKTGASWALNNQTYLYMNGWFHYAKLYAALAGCIGFMMIKYEWGIGKTHWFKAYPFAIVAINILIAVASDFESAINGWYSWWLSSEDVWLYGGWHNVFNGIAGIINILCMTGWWAVYTSKDKKDMIWPDMIWVYILVYDVWNFAYTYNCLPTHSWFCGVALLLAPTIAALLWNKGGWIMNRANTLCIWCMFAQVFPLFQETFSDGKQVFPWATIPKLYADGTLNGITTGGSTNADPTMMTIVSLLALIVNIVAFIYIIRTARKKKKNPYKEEIFTDFKYYKNAAARAEIK